MSWENRLLRFKNWFDSRSAFGQVLIMTLGDKVIVLTIGVLAALIFGKEVLGLPNPMADESGAFMFIMGVLIAPWLETLIFQYGIIELILLILRKFSRKMTVAVVVSAMTFGFAHNYSPLYIAIITCIGFYYAMIYVFFRPYGKKSAFQKLAFVHMLSNFVVFLTITLE